jgi:hypothetical protein
MIPNGLFSQIVLFIFAIGICLAYVIPEFQAIGEVQDTIAIYQAERAKVAEVNQRLNDLRLEVSSIPFPDRDALDTYLPEQVDTIAVQRDIQAISSAAGVLLRSVIVTELSQGDVFDISDTDTTLPYPYGFIVNIEGTYDQIKQFFQVMQQNNYPLEAYDFVLTPRGGGFMTLETTVVTFGNQPPEPASN